MYFPTQNLFNVLLKTKCPLCQRSTPKTFCTYCENQLEQQRLEDPAAGWNEQPGVFAWGQYEGGLKRAIAQFKYEDQRHLAHTFGTWIAQAWVYSLCKGVIVVPIPLHEEKLKKRGFNQAELLARRFCQVTGCILRPNGLKRKHNTEALFNLSKADREATLVDAFEIGRDCDQAVRFPVVLFDDIYTSGATVRSATRTLRRSGFDVQGVIVLARTPRHPSNDG
jgi:ComF family protein